MSAFTTTLRRHLEVEGGWASGLDGDTYKGITRRYHGDWPGWTKIDVAKVASGFPHNLETWPGLQAEVRGFYYHEFWEPMQLEHIAKQEIADELFDAGAGPNGKGTAVKIAQGALILLGKNIKLDGKMGLKTVAALNDYPHTADLVKLMNMLQFCAFLFGSGHVNEVRALIKDRLPLLRRFLRGWLRRVTI